MKQFQLLLVAVAGAAAGVPGMLGLGKLDVPGGADELFKFVLAAFSAAAVLSVYVARTWFQKLGARTVVALMSAGMTGVLVLLFSYIVISSKVLVAHSWRGEQATQFVPLFLPARADSLITAVGSRAQFIAAYGPDALIPYVTETNVAMTLIVLLLNYTLLVSMLAVSFGVVGFHPTAMAGDRAVPTTKDGDINGG